MFFKKMKITHKIFGIIATGMIMCASFAILAVVFGQSQANTFNEQVVPLDNLRKIQSKFRELEYKMAGVQSEIVTSIAAAPHLEHAMIDIENLWNALTIYMPDTEEKEKFEKGLQGFKGMSGTLKAAYLNEDDIEDLYDEWLDYKPLILKSIDKMAEAKKSEVSNHYEESNKLIIRVSRVIVIISGIALCVFALFAILIVRTIKKPIHTVVEAAGKVAEGDLNHIIHINTQDEMGSMAARLNQMIENLREAFRKIIVSVENMSADTEGLTNMSKQLLEGAEEQRSKGEQVAVASTEMAQSIMDVAKNTTEATDVTKESFETAAAGKDIVSGTVESITRLADSVSEASKTIEGLGGSVNEIGEIVSVIQEIADQTNLLALNAAIEAARSGEHGRGFAVVADEVRKLAERTATATDEIASKINVIQTESKASISIMEKGTVLAEESVSTAKEAGEALQKIVNSSDKVMEIVQSVAAATEEQSSAAEEVSQTMEHISEIINQHCGLSEKVEKSASSLNALAREVIEQTSYFKTSGSGNGSEEAAYSESSDSEEISANNVTA
jgi:methyl-accepting chemotaxis protein